MKYISIFFISVFLLLACNQKNTNNSHANNTSYEVSTKDLQKADSEAVLTLAGGCFWCTEAIYERIKGVNRVYSGYSGGKEENPKYRRVSSGYTSHAEAIQIYYDPNIVSLETLLKVFFTAAHDPTQLNRQGPDIGKQYRSIAFYRNIEEKAAIENMIKIVDESNQYQDPIVTQVVEFEKFWPAEEYHQDYVVRNPDNVPYVNNVTKPKINKFVKMYPDLLKSEYK